MSSEPWTSLYHTLVALVGKFTLYSNTLWNCGSTITPLQLRYPIAGQRQGLHTLEPVDPLLRWTPRMSGKFCNCFNIGNLLIRREPSDHCWCTDQVLLHSGVLYWVVIYCEVGSLQLSPNHTQEEGRLGVINPFRPNKSLGRGDYHIESTQICYLQPPSTHSHYQGNSLNQEARQITSQLSLVVIKVLRKQQVPIHFFPIKEGNHWLSLSTQ